MGETKVSSAEDFPNVAVYKRDEALGPVYRIVFYNKEFVKGLAFLPRWLAVAASFFAFWPLSCAVVANVESAWGFLVFPAGFLLMALALDWANRPRPVKRVIELDGGADRLRVLKNRRVEIERPLSRMSPNLTVVDHPDADYERQLRQERRPEETRWDRKISEAEKTHCLMGYFGVGGAEQVLLLCRAEWPSRHSLIEVQQAIYWSRDKLTGKRPDERHERESMNPPRD